MPTPDAPAAPAATLWGRLADQTAATRPATGVVFCTADTPAADCAADPGLLHVQAPARLLLDAEGAFRLTIHCCCSPWTVRYAGWTRHWNPTPGTLTNIRDLPEA